MSDYSFMKSGFNNLVTQQDENFEQNMCYLPQKKQRTCRIQIQVEEV